MLPCALGACVGVMELSGVSVLVLPSLRLAFFVRFRLSFSPLIKVRSPTKQISPHTTQHNTTQKQSKAQPAEQQCNLARTRRTSLLLSYLYRVVVVVVRIPSANPTPASHFKTQPNEETVKKKKVVRRKQYTGIKTHTLLHPSLPHTQHHSPPYTSHPLHPPLRTAKRAPARQTRRVSARVSHCGTGTAASTLRPTRAGQACARACVRA
jgi:hypothetical protein